MSPPGRPKGESPSAQREGRPTVGAARIGDRGARHPPGAVHLHALLSPEFGDRIGQGKDNTRLFLKEHPEMAREIEDKIRAKLVNAKLGAGAATAEVEEA